MLLHGHRVVCPALDRGVVGDDQSPRARETRPMPVTMPAPGASSAVHAVRRQRRELQERGSGIEQRRPLRSRTNIFFCSAWRSRPAPPSRARASSVLSRATRRSIARVARESPHERGVHAGLDDRRMEDRRRMFGRRGALRRRWLLFRDESSASHPPSRVFADGFDEVCVDVPGRKISRMPSAFSFAMSLSGMIPPARTTMSSPPFSFKSFRISGKSTL